MFFKNPFTMEGNWYRGNIHTHSTNSDSDLTPEEVVNWYRDRGYDFISITDHNKVTDPSQFSDSNFLTILGTELDGGEKGTKEHYHIVGVGFNEVFDIPAKEPNPQRAIDLINSRGGEAFFAHPYWLGQDPGDLMPYEGAIGLEVFNTSCMAGIGKGLSSVHWDNLLDSGKRLWGLAVDDAHWHRPDACGGWVMVKAKSLTKENIMKSLSEGYFYSSRGPQIQNIEVEDSTVKVSCSPVATVNFICDRWNGRSIRARDQEILMGAEYTLKGEEKYIRIECIDATGRIAWSNPIFLS